MTRLLRPLALVFVLGLSAAPVATAQEVTDGFFTRPPSNDPDEGKGNSVPGYLVTSLFAAGAVFALCKSSRR